MTRGEAIKVLREKIDDRPLFKDEREAFELAIKALHREEAEEKGYCHRILPSNVEVVVRCKDCIHYEKHETWSACTYWSGDPYEQASVIDEDFCSYGERREP